MRHWPRSIFRAKIRSARRSATGDLAPKSMRQVVGVIANVREGGLDQEVWPAEYFSMYHGPDSFIAVAVRTSAG